MAASTDEWAGTAPSPLRILTWHVHGSYLDSLLWTGHEFYLPVGPGGRGGIGGWTWPRDRVHEVREDEVRNLDVDLVLFQADENWHDGPRILSDAQLRGPRIYVEHDPPWNDPTDERHLVDDPEVLLVHVTQFNALMWDSGSTPTRVIEHGVPEPEGVRWSGELERGIVVFNELGRRARRGGRDIVDRVRAEVPLDVVGIDSELVGGLGEVKRHDLPAFTARYRLFLHPPRYTSFGLAVVEAMHLGMPIVALATTEMPAVLENGRSGIIATDPDRLVDGARELLADRELARRIGEAGREVARERFSISRFAADWNRAFDDVARGSTGGSSRRAHVSRTGNERAMAGTAAGGAD